VLSPRRGVLFRPATPDRSRDLDRSQGAIERALARGDDSALTLVSAPGGFGKTTVLTEWLATARAEGQLTAWLSLDHPDNDPALFWTYL
jgi:LuxR family maltose regulon positive regulatory protein